jgi:SNF2 family DNA or RNA helicase
MSGRGSILGDDPGLGKSIQAIAALAAIRAFPVIIVCPASVKIHWHDEWKFAHAEPVVHIVNGQYTQLEAAHVYITNYALLKSREQQLLSLKPKCWVFDEAQLLRQSHPGARHRAAVATRLVHNSRAPAVHLTGTPVDTRVKDLWRLLHILDRREWPLFDQFNDRYCVANPSDLTGKSIVTPHARVQHLQELQVRIAPYILRRRKSAVLSELPAKTVQSVKVSLPPDVLHHYRLVEQDVVRWLRTIGSAGRAARAKNAIGIVKLQMLRRLAALGKIAAAVPKLLKAWFGVPRPRPLVVFGYHRDVMQRVFMIARQLKISMAGIGGSESPERRHAQVQRFQRGEAQLFLAPLKAAGTGINLQRASDVWVLERLFSPSTMRQAEDRVHRIGQVNPVTITYLDAIGTVDEQIASVLAARGRVIDAVVSDDDDNRGAVLQDTVSVAAQVAAVLAR